MYAFLLFSSCPFNGENYYFSKKNYPPIYFLRKKLKWQKVGSIGPPPLVGFRVEI
jgi:hypothetical protein